MFIENWNEIQKHTEAFWNQDYYERCSISMRGPKEIITPMPDYGLSLKEQYTNPDYLFEKAMNRIGNMNFYGEAIPTASIDFGPAGHAAYFGAVPEYGSSIWYETGIDEDDIAQVKYQDQFFQEHLQIVKRLGELSKGKILMAMPDNCGIVDALALIRGNDNLLIDMIDNPEFVSEAIPKIIDVWKKTQDVFFDTLKENSYGGSTHDWMQIWCPKRHAQIQCDYSAMISPAMYEEFVLPELIETSKFLDQTTYHLDGQEQIRHLDIILSVDTITNIQWTPVAGQPRTSEFIPVLRKIQESGKGLILLPEVDEVPAIVDNLSHKGLHLMIEKGITSKQIADDILNYATKAAKYGKL
ncbi:MAG: hypothetical protein R3Y24_12325 [Eubacteriales bacterium]